MAEAGERAGIPVTLCGELGGKPLEAMALLALGFRVAVDVACGHRPGQGDADGRSTSRSCAPILEPLLEATNGRNPTIRPQLVAYAEKHDVPV